MTKLSKMYLGLSRVSRRSAAASPGRRHVEGDSWSRPVVDPSVVTVWWSAVRRRCRGRSPATPGVTGLGSGFDHTAVELRVDRDRDPDLLAEGDGERVLEARAQPALELGRG